MTCQSATCTAYGPINQSSHSSPALGISVVPNASEEARLYSGNNRENALTQKSLIELVNCHLETGAGIVLAEIFS